MTGKTLEDIFNNVSNYNDTLKSVGYSDDEINVYVVVNGLFIYKGSSYVLCYETLKRHLNKEIISNILNAHWNGEKFKIIGTCNIEIIIV